LGKPINVKKSAFCDKSSAQELSMDSDHWLNYLTAEGIIISQSFLKGDWGVEMESAQGTYFHFVAQGSALFATEGGKEICLGAGDLIVLPRGDAHVLKRFKDSKTLSLGRFISHSKGLHRRDPDATSFICGTFGIDRDMVMPAIKSLPNSLHLRSESRDLPSAITDTLKQLRAEVEHSRLGSQVVIRHLLSTLFVYVLREWSENSAQEAGNWFSAMQNPLIAKALACIHEKPHHTWTLERLAQEASMSRSAFAKQFRVTVGETPHSYLTRWRLGIAAQLLGQTTLSIGEIAYKVGFQSEYSFNRAFKTARGITPAKAREQQRVDAVGPMIPV
jgi:AraC family transcriptional activator of mtrCDE